MVSPYWPHSVPETRPPPLHSHFLSPPPDLSKKQMPRMEEEEEAYGWMDFGRRSAEEGDQRN